MLTGGFRAGPSWRSFVRAVWLKSFLVSAVAAAGATYAVSASAAHRFVHSFDCEARSGSLTRDDSRGSSVNASTSLATNVVCAIPDDSGFPVQQAGSLTFQGIDASNLHGITVVVCATNASDDTRTCSASQSSSTLGYGRTTLSFTRPWTSMSFGAVPYVHITLPYRSLPGALTYYSSVRSLLLQ